MEEWRALKNENNIYAVSNLGNIKNMHTNHILSKHLNTTGYERVQLMINGKQKKFFVHRLVAEYFVDGMADGLVVNHIDGNKLNNNASNLEWCTRSENDLHAFRLGLRTVQKTSKPKHRVICTDVDTKSTLEFASVFECADYFNSSAQYIRECCNAKNVFEHIRFGKYYIEYIK